MRSLSFLLIAGVLLLLSLAGTVSAENETISISANVPMKVEYREPTYIESLNKTGWITSEREVLVTQTDSEVYWASMDIATGENFTFTFIADNLVNGTEYSFSYEIISPDGNFHSVNGLVFGGDTLDNASHLFIANNTEEYSYNLGGQFPDTGWENCTKVQVKVGFVKNPNSDNGTQKKLESFSSNKFYSSSYESEICNPPDINDNDSAFTMSIHFFLIVPFAVLALISIGLIALFRRK